MTNCPFCGSVYHSTHPPLSFSSRQRLIYDTVAAGGPRGATIKTLKETVFGDTPPKTAGSALRVYIFEINRKLVKEQMKQKIKGRRDIGYVLTHDSQDGEFTGTE